MHPTGVHTDSHTYAYDAAGRLVRETVSYDGGAPVSVQQLSYNAVGQLASNDLGAFTEAYTYNVRGAMTGRKSDVFEQTISFSNHFDRLYNGSIGMITDKLTGGKSTTSGYSYDNAGRLTSAMIFLDGKTRPTGYTYDLNGNIIALNRLGYNPPSLAERIDDLVYQYDGNKVRKITEKAPVVISEKTMNFVDGADEEIEYTYDRNGNMTSDANRGMDMKWDANNRLSKVENDVMTMSFGRTGSGTKLSKNVYTGPKLNPTYPGLRRSNSLGGYPFFPRDSVPVFPGDSVISVYNATLTEYFGAYEYVNGRFSRLNTPTGYRDSVGTHVYVRDWQGNIRAVVRKGADGKVELEQATYYYHYGMPMAESTNPTINKYKYTGKELLTDQGVNILDYGPRPYDPTTGIWWSVDEHSADYASMSHYTMCACDPINHIDPDGKDWIYHDEFGYKWDKNITAESKLEDGWVYVGSENNSILEHLGLSGTSYSYSMKCMGAGGSNYEEGQGFSYNNLMVNINLFFKFTPLINCIDNKKSFEGVRLDIIENQSAVNNNDITISPASTFNFDIGGKQIELYPRIPSEPTLYPTGATSQTTNYIFDAKDLMENKMIDRIKYSTGWNYNSPAGNGSVGGLGIFNFIGYRRTKVIRFR